MFKLYPPIKLKEKMKKILRLADWKDVIGRPGRALAYALPMARWVSNRRVMFGLKRFRIPSLCMTRDLHQRLWQQRQQQQQDRIILEARFRAWPAAGLKSSDAVFESRRDWENLKSNMWLHHNHRKILVNALTIRNEEAGSLENPRKWIGID